MKKIIAALLACLFAFSLTIISAAAAEHGQAVEITMSIGSPYMTVNGQRRVIDGEGSVPFIENDRTLVPFRAIFETLNLTVDWNYYTQTITGTRGDLEIILTIGSEDVYRNGTHFSLDVAPQIVNDRTMVPLRFIAESVDARVTWNDLTQTVYIEYSPFSVRFFNDVYIKIGDDLGVVEEQLGVANRIDPGHGNFEWHVFNSDPSRFIMVGIRDNTVAALYTNSRWFVTGFARYGDTGVTETEHGGLITFRQPVVRLYTDSFLDDKVHAVLIVCPDTVLRQSFDEEFFRAQERQNFDAVNAFRVNHGIAPLIWCDVAALTARQHSQDMADNDFFAHDSLDGTTFTQRFQRNGGTFATASENLAGRFPWPLGVTFLDDWINSTTGHRSPIMNDMLTHVGVGMAANPNSTYRYYIGQIFYRPVN